MTALGKHRKKQWNGAARLAAGCVAQIACMTGAYAAAGSWEAAPTAWAGGAVLAGGATAWLGLKSRAYFHQTLELHESGERLVPTASALALGCSAAGTGFAALTFILQATRG